MAQPKTNGARAPLINQDDIAQLEAGRELVRRQLTVKPRRRTVTAAGAQLAFGAKVFGRKGLAVPRNGAIEVQIVRADGSAKTLRLQRGRRVAKLVAGCRYKGQAAPGAC